MSIDKRSLLNYKSIEYCINWYYVSFVLDFYEFRQMVD